MEASGIGGLSARSPARSGLRDGLFDTSEQGSWTQTKRPSDLEDRTQIRLARSALVDADRSAVDARAQRERLLGEPGLPARRAQGRAEPNGGIIRQLIAMRALRRGLTVGGADPAQQLARLQPKRPSYAQQRGELRRALGPLQKPDRRPIETSGASELNLREAGATASCAHVLPEQPNLLIEPGVGGVPHGPILHTRRWEGHWTNASAERRDGTFCG